MEPKEMAIIMLNCFYGLSEGKTKQNAQAACDIFIDDWSKNVSGETKELRLEIIRKLDYWRKVKTEIEAL